MPARKAVAELRTALGRDTIDEAHCRRLAVLAGSRIEDADKAAALVDRLITNIHSAVEADDLGGARIYYIDEALEALDDIEEASSFG